MELYHSVVVKKCTPAGKRGRGLLTRACRRTPPAANTSECDAAGGRSRPCTSASVWCHTGKNPPERSGTSRRSAAGLDKGEATF